jgi:hypothetical protein
MRRQLFGLAAAGLLAISAASEANAQFAVSVGNPYTGQTYSVSGGMTPYGYEVTSFSTPAPVYAPTSFYVSSPVTTYATSYVAPTVSTSYVVPTVSTVLPTTYVSPTSYYTATSYTPTIYTPTTYAVPTSYYAATSYVAPTAYYAPTGYGVAIPTSSVQPYAPVYPTGYAVGYQPGLVGRVMRAIYGGPVLYPY